jgi:polyribonucleotide nucleotidyltransferase
LARTVQFPKAEADGNVIKIEGNKDVVDKIIATIEAMIAQRESEVVETIDVPIDKHRSIIGRGGEIRKELETKFNVSIDIPRQGSSQTGVKISGQPKDVAQAKDYILSLVKEEEGETIQVPRNLHHAISDNGQFFRKLKKDHQVNVDHAGHKIPPKPAASSNTRANSGALPLITDDHEVFADVHSWNVVNILDSKIDGEIPWVLRGSPENVAKAKASLIATLEQARKNTTTGYLVLPDPRTYRYVIGQGGSKVNSIRKQTGCKITVPRDQAKDEAIEICGSAEGVERAKELILQAVKEGTSNEADGSRA